MTNGAGGPRDRMALLRRGVAAGAVGTVALEAATWLDVGLRGRSPSRTPQETVQAAARLLHVPLPADPRSREAWSRHAGAVLGLGAGTAAGAALGAVRPRLASPSPVVTAATAWLLALAVGNLPMVALGVTNPLRWDAEDWVTDLAPHLAYAAAAAAWWHRAEGR